MSLKDFFTKNGFADLDEVILKTHGDSNIDKMTYLDAFTRYMGVSTLDMILLDDYKTNVQKLRFVQIHFNSWLTRNDPTNISHHNSQMSKMVILLLEEIRRYSVDSIRSVVITLQDKKFELDTILDFIEPMVHQLVVHPEDRYRDPFDAGDDIEHDFTEPNMVVEYVNLINTFLTQIFDGLDFDKTEVTACCAKHQWSKPQTALHTQPASQQFGIYNAGGGIIDNRYGGNIYCVPRAAKGLPDTMIAKAPDMDKMFDTMKELTESIEEEDVNHNGDDDANE